MPYIRLPFIRRKGNFVMPPATENSGSALVKAKKPVCWNGMLLQPFLKASVVVLHHSEHLPGLLHIILKSQALIVDDVDNCADETKAAGKEV